jgi:hypothetical protein
VELLLAEAQRSFVVTGGTALLDFGGLTRAPASWSLQLMLRGQAPSGRFALQGCPGNGTEVDDGQGNRIRLETRP